MSRLHMGIDVGSTTVKVVVLDENNNTLFAEYRRHFSDIKSTVKGLFAEVKEVVKNEQFTVVITGSGGLLLSKMLDLPFVQEVIANKTAIKTFMPETDVVIELGGEDAKILYLSGGLEQRMNGTCAGGTGSFIDQMSILLKTDADGLNALAENHTIIYPIAARCGVFAKSDVQPLLNEGAAREDIAASILQAVVTQTISGLAQGRPIKGNIVFLGGPLHFLPQLRRQFEETLKDNAKSFKTPENAQLFVAIGAALMYEDKTSDIDTLISQLANAKSVDAEITRMRKLFETEDERKEFFDRHGKDVARRKDISTANGPVFLGLDVGSTTIKAALINEDGDILYDYYGKNEGSPITCGIKILRELYSKLPKSAYIANACTTGYGELLLKTAFRIEEGEIETIAHYKAANYFSPGVDFIIDIGGQDMKCMKIRNGVIDSIMLNEACSSGCGSFLENFASNLNIDVKDIAKRAFSSVSPAHLGSRCTVFMNSTIINEQRDGKNPDDIMAGLCRSIIENVFTKVVRVANTKELGEKVVVQGGTFRNRAVLRAIEEYLDMNVTLAPFPGEMGALGAALAAKKHIKEEGYANGESSSFIGFEAVKKFEYTTQSGVRCEHCGNHCLRNVLTFPDGGRWVTGNRCENGLILDETAAVLEDTKENSKENAVLDVFAMREKMLFKAYDYKEVSKHKDITIGIPRVLEFFDSMPFWTTFFKALGYNVKLSHKSNRKMYEKGLKYVASDTICFPAKLVHGHIEDLASQNVDRIFMPYVMHMPPEGTDKLSPYVCSVVMGYPMVVRNSQNPEKQYGVKFDTPIFHWFSKKDRRHQIIEYAVNELSVSKSEAEEAYRQAADARNGFKGELIRLSNMAIDNAKKNNTFAVVLAGRPYHTDPFVSKNISKMLAKKGIAVIPVDGLDKLNEQVLSNTRAEITNNFHTRMLSAAMIAAKTPELEYVQIVSFGCGHDAILSDEIIRIMNESGHKPPLILKVDESDATGALGIRIQSFIKSVQIRRGIKDEEFIKKHMYEELKEPSPAKFYRKDKKIRTILVPNISVEVSKILEGILEKENFKVKRIPIGSTEQIKLGKKYVHNDICFPAQMVIGELIGELKRGGYNQDEVAVGMVKFQCDCRMSHYAGLLRKGLDSAGFSNVPILTTDVNDTKRNHPGVFLLGVSAVLEAVWSFMMLDMLTDVCRKTRPYEINKGETDRVYQQCVDNLAKAIKSGIGSARKAFEQGMKDMAAIHYDRSHLKPKVFITGELLVTYHSGSNFNIERYMEENGMETIFPRITDQLRKDFLASMAEIKDYNANIFPYPFAVDWLFDHVQKSLEKTAVLHPLYKKALRPRDMYQGVKNIIPETLSCGEGWLMAAEIVHYAKEGVKSFIILQPFGCLPNHICGRGVIKRIKEDYPNVTILPLDLDPDTSYANVENRMQMMIMNS